MTIPEVVKSMTRRGEPQNERMTMNKPVPGSELMHAVASETPARKRICIVTGELEGPHFNGGIGTANRALAIVLHELGYDVDILYTHVEKGVPQSLRGPFADHVLDYLHLGIRLMCIDSQGERDDWQLKSFLALQHLLEHRYSIVFFDDFWGNAYYPLLARKTGNENLQDTLMCVITNSAIEWIADVTRNSILNFENLALMEMERRSVELADVIKTPSAYILEKYRNYGWPIAPNVIVLPNFVSGGVKTEYKPARRKIKEIVFFGRIERRKGLRIFCRALDRIKFELKDYTVTFLGKASPEITNKLIRKSATWPFALRLLTNFGQAQAISYLTKGDRLAVMPSTEDNSPAVIIECLEQNIPFLASSGSGGAELLDEESRRENLFEPSVDGLCEKLLEAIASGGKTARPSFNSKEMQRTFSQWLQKVLASAERDKGTKGEKGFFRNRILIVIVPPETSVDRALAELKDLHTEFRGNLRIEILASKPDAFAKGIAAWGQACPINVNDIRDFQKIATALGREEPGLLGICHISQLLTSEWFERAQTCFERVEHVSALTGMAGEIVEKNEPADMAYVSAPDKRYAVQRYLMGNAPPLFALMPSTNSGFLLMRSELAALLGTIELIDQKYDRLERMEDLIHAMLLNLHRSGRNFELVPDLLHVPVRENPLQIQEPGSFLRSLAADLYGHAPGTDQFLISRLAIDAGLKRRRLSAAAQYRDYLAAKTGVKISSVDESVTWDQQSRELAMVAQASGQIQLSVDLLRERLGHATKTVRLTDLLSSPRCLRNNLNHKWSLLVAEETRDIRLHANSVHEGRATLLFTSIDLGQITHFSSNLKASDGCNPIRVRVDLISLERTKSYSSDIVVATDEEAEWKFAVPEKFRTDCRVSISVEMADPEDNTHNGYVHIVDARFVAEPGERQP